MSYLPLNSSFIPPTVTKPYSNVKRAPPPTVLGKRSLPYAHDAYDTLDDLAANYKTLPDVDGNEENERAAKRQRGGDSSGIIIGGTAGRGSLGPPGCNYTKTKKDPILAHERTSVIPYQVSVVTLCAVPRPDTLYEERRREAARYPATDLIAPVQDAGCFRVNKGELVFSLMSGTGAPLRNVHEYDGFPNVFSSVNGLHYSARLRFEGFMAFNQAPSHPDEVGTLQRFGTCTVNWTGPFPGYAGQIVYFSPYPYVREVDGQIEPAIRLLGAPGQEGEKDELGVSRAKFVPSLYVLNEQETATAIRSIERDLEGKIRKRMHTTKRAQGGAGAPTGFQLNEIDSICKDIETNHFLRHPQLFALRDYAIVCVYLMVFEAQLALNKVNGGTITPNMIAIGRAFFKRLKEYYAHMQQESNAFRESLSAKSAAYSHPILQPEIDAELANDAAWYTMDSAFFRGHYYTLSQLLVRWAHRLQIYLFNQQEDFLRSHCIGTLMRDTHPGGSADLLLGAFYR